jgi:hypothetical protein
MKRPETATFLPQTIIGDFLLSFRGRSYSVM